MQVYVIKVELGPFRMLTKAELWQFSRSDIHHIVTST